MSSGHLHKNSGFIRILKPPSNYVKLASIALSSDLEIDCDLFCSDSGLVLQYQPSASDIL